MGIGDWGLGIWGLGIGPIPKAQTPSSKPPSPHPPKILFFFKKKKIINKKIKLRINNLKKKFQKIKLFIKNIIKYKYFLYI